MLHLQTPPLYTSEQLAPAPLPNLTPIPPSLQSAAAAEVPLKVTLEVLTKAPPPVLTMVLEEFSITYSTSEVSTQASYRNQFLTKIYKTHNEISQQQLNKKL